LVASKAALGDDLFCGFSLPWMLKNKI
ncbi:hypothetical protein D046_4005B, partial [Vibrio parahaemolyticus V-223/04]